MARLLVGFACMCVGALLSTVSHQFENNMGKKNFCLRGGFKTLVGLIVEIHFPRLYYQVCKAQIYLVKEFFPFMNS